MTIVPKKAAATIRNTCQNDEDNNNNNSLLKFQTSYRAILNTCFIKSLLH